ncbi:MAG: aldo/keto reductase, partial [Lachnospiraceae bacterium]|nr:aldo/keto reductase [Lachnospiraceae bacterium]
MNYRRLGKTGLMVSEVGFGGEWLEHHEAAEAADVIRYAAAQGINIIDCWNPNPENRDRLGLGLAGNREHWILQGHIGATWQNGQYVRTR